MTLPRRIQLVKLLRANGLRDVERMREHELKEALLRLRIVIPDLPMPVPVTTATPSSSTITSRPAEAPLLVDDGDDIYALPRFREPKLFLPDHQRTFLRAIPVKGRVLFCTWDVRAVERSIEGPLQLHLFWREFLGDAPDAQDLLAQEPAARVDVELSSPGWYVNIPGERLALAAALVVNAGGKGRRLVASNLCITPPTRPAPPGPLWLATLSPSMDRRPLAAAKVFAAADTNLRRVGETDARFVDVDEGDVASSARLPWSGHLTPGSSASSSAAASSGASGAFGGGGGRGSET